MTDLTNHWIFPKDVAVVVNVSQRFDEHIANELAKRGVEYHHLPLDEEVNDIGWKNIKKAVVIILQADKEDKRVVVHCDFGVHRSRLVVEAFHFAKYGEHLIDEYKGFANRLIYNCMSHHLPEMSHIEKELQKLIEKG